MFKLLVQMWCLVLYKKNKIKKKKTNNLHIFKDHSLTDYLCYLYYLCLSEKLDLYYTELAKNMVRLPSSLAQDTHK